MLSYISSEKLAGRPVTLTATMIAAAIGIFATTFFGAWTDKIGRRPVYLLGTAIMVVWGIPLFLVVNTGSAVLIVIAFVISYSVCQNSLAGVQGAWFSELFNAKTRTTGASLAYQLSAVVSGFTPLVATALYIGTGWIGPAILFSVYGLLGLRRRAGRPGRPGAAPSATRSRPSSAPSRPRAPSPRRAADRVDQRELTSCRPDDHRTTREDCHDLTRPPRRPPAAGTDRADRIARHPRRRLPDPAATPSPRARCRARATSARRSASPTSSPWSTPTSCATGRRPALGRPRPVPALDRPLRHRALRGAGRGRDHPGRGAGDLRLRRVPAADVGHGVLHARHGDLRRLAGPRPGRRHRDGARAAPPGQPGAGLQPALRRRARRGLDVGGGAADRPPRPGQRHRDRRRQRPAGRRPDRGHPAHRAGPGQVAGVRLARPAGRRQRHRRRSSTRSTSSARTRARPGC